MINPVLTVHARERAAEMGIGTKSIKRIVRSPETDYPSRGARIATNRSVDDRVRVVYDATNPARPEVITVVWNTQETYVR